MKKILIGAITALALLFGMTGCSGDLHNDEKATYDLSAGGIAGAGVISGWSNVVSWSEVDSNVYKYTFIADAAEIEWKVLFESGKWNEGAWGGEGSVKEVGTDEVTLDYDGKSGAGKNCKSSFTKGKAYSIVITCKEDGSVTAKIVEDVVPTPFYLQNMYIRGGMIDWNPSVAGSLLYKSKDDSTGYVSYAVDFTCSDVSNNQFGIVDGSTNWAVKYTGANITVDGDFVATVKGADDNNKITGLVAGKSYRIIVQTTPEEEVLVKVVTLVSFNIKGCKLTNYAEDVGSEGNQGIYFCEGWIPNNGWDGNFNAGTNKATKDGDVYKLDFGTAYSVICLESELAEESSHIQIVNAASKDTFWDNKVCGGADASWENCENGKTYYLVYDADSGEASLVAVD